MWLALKYREQLRRPGHEAIAIPAVRRHRERRPSPKSIAIISEANWGLRVAILWRLAAGAANERAARNDSRSQGDHTRRIQGYAPWAAPSLPAYRG